MNTAIEQFVEDYLLVVENDQDMYNEARALVGESDGVVEASDALRNQYESLIAQVVEVVGGKISAEASLLVSQLLNGWGSAAFDAIARRLQEK